MNCVSHPDRYRLTALLVRRGWRLAVLDQMTVVQLHALTEVTR